MYKKYKFDFKKQQKPPQGGLFLLFLSCWYVFLQFTFRANRRLCIRHVNQYVPGSVEQTPYQKNNCGFRCPFPKMQRPTKLPAGVSTTNPMLSSETLRNVTFLVKRFCDLPTKARPRGQPSQELWGCLGKEARTHPFFIPPRSLHKVYIAYKPSAKEYIRGKLQVFINQKKCRTPLTR
jgi:hypothetical protein